MRGKFAGRLALFTKLKTFTALMMEKVGLLPPEAATFLLTINT
jgi:hypothetical protein